ncbi:NLI interacting factor family phosphatase [Acanthamoeba castellanii str. Neff]|uniref:Mitochondrial import inner membrane translocase subunit TIM50 n=1 Tax=Acanthamoeba castellanii (strain ATCC 30010 / Neff) TaxID=1257118 RepID=L8HJJ8_ACACF|nr:NLI interacting factor family phosphatase [Acanthamoeba castellanii str. Neff]ELR25382.1 NLI interacting factor family phosphatase [Acanthamoeba castellanii str. Neff]
MDETLLHAQPVIGCSPRPDSRVIQFEFKEQLLAVDYVTRPGVFPFLDQLLVEGYKLAVFTAGIQPYADAVLDSFDPTGRYFGRGDRFYRQHMVGGKKDLRAVFGDDLSGVVLIDDNAHDIVPEDQLDHAVCVDHWRGDPSTTPQALASLKRAAKALANKQTAMSDLERQHKEAKAAIEETRWRRASAMRAWLMAVARERCKWAAVKKQVGVEEVRVEEVCIEEVRIEEVGVEEVCIEEVGVEEVCVEEDFNQGRFIFNFFITLIIMIGAWVMWNGHAEEGLTKEEEVPIKELAVEEVGIEEVGIEEVRVEEVGVEEVGVQEVSVEEVGVKEVGIKEVSVEEVSIKDVSIKEVSVKEVGVEEVSIEEVSVKEVSIKEVCIKEVHVKEVCIDEVHIKEDHMVKPHQRRRPARVRPAATFKGWLFSISQQDLPVG